MPKRVIVHETTGGSFWGGGGPAHRGRVEDEIVGFVENGEHALILRANVHGLNLAYHNPRLRGILDRARIVFCDGSGVMLAACMLGRGIPERVTYADWVWQLAGFGEMRELSHFFFGARPGVA